MNFQWNDPFEMEEREHRRHINVVASLISLAITSTLTFALIFALDLPARFMAIPVFSSAISYVIDNYLKKNNY